MDIKKYEVFLKVLEKGCFAGACEELGYTQPAITSMMKSMEREIGFPLLRRSTKGVKLTSEGRTVLPLIQKLVEDNRRLTYRYDELRGLETGHLRVGVFPTVSFAWMPRIISRFEKQYPNIHIELLEENSLVQLEEWLSDGFIDVAFFSRQPEHSFKWIHIKNDPLVALIPKEHSEAECSYIKAEQFRTLPILMCKTKDGLDADIMRYFATNGVPELKIRLASNMDYTIANMVREGVGVGVLPELLVHSLFRGGDPDVCVRPMHPPAYRELGMAMRREEDVCPALNCFSKFIRLMADELREV